ncbi:MAG: CDP-alcohol phosphatidyltransferase family protein [Anaerolineales bacterium]
MLLAVVTAVYLFLGYAWLSAQWAPTYAARWLGLAAAVSIVELSVLFWWLPFNRRPGEQELLHELGPGTLATFSRGLMLSGAAGFAFLPRPPGILAWVPMALFTLGELLDYVDGYLARKTNHVTRLGESLDLEFDILGMLIGSGLAVWHRVLPWPFLIIGAATYLFRLGVWIRQRSSRPVLKLPASTSRRPIAGLMMGYLSVMLWPIVDPPATTFVGLFFLVPFLASFTRDWLVVSGAVDPHGERYARWRMRARSILLRWIPLPVRAMLVLTLIQQWVGGDAYLAERRVLQNSAWPVILLEAVLGAMFGLGIAGRVAAFVMLFPVGLSIAFGGFNPSRALALGGALTILILGTGKFSLWQPEESLGAGERRA